MPIIIHDSSTSVNPVQSELKSFSTIEDSLVWENSERKTKSHEKEVFAMKCSVLFLGFTFILLVLGAVLN
ncbi:hypothetical protein V6R21_28205 [Limibacter armeniacum]|uniref:hypothetical protein n=1 Tax=Limibacter armeniacum TaxID=466084 RepID=UPI002FE642B9